MTVTATDKCPNCERHIRMYASVAHTQQRAETITLSCPKCRSALTSQRVEGTNVHYRISAGHFAPVARGRA